MKWEVSVLAVAGIVALVVLSAPAIAEEDDPRVKILHDAGENGTTHAGVLNTFGWVLLDDDGAPAFHQDAVFEVVFEGTTLLKTSASSGHDYDGIDPYQVTFPAAGNYTVRATVHDDGDKRTSTLTGQVLPASPAQASLEVDAPETAQAGQPIPITYQVTGPDGAPVEHVDVTISIRRAMDAFEVFRTTTHDRDGEHELTYSFSRTGAFDIVLTATPVAAHGEPIVGPTTKTVEIEVAEADLDPGVPTPTTERPLNNSRETGDQAAPYQLFGTYDPYTTVGPHGRLSLGAIAIDAETGALARGVDYTADLTGPHGRQLFHSTSLHSADGFLEVTTSRPTVGEYKLHVSAQKGDWSDEVTLTFGVLPPAAAANNGALVVDLNATGAPETGMPFTFPIQVDDAGGAPAMHSEVDWRVLDTDDVPIYGGKLHTHQNATFPLTVTFPTSGAHTVEALPHSLQPTPTPFTYGEEIGQPPVFGVDVAEGPGLPATPGTEIDPSDTDASSGAPSLGTMLSIGTIGLVAVALRRSKPR